MQHELFSDGIGEITISGSIVRVDLMSLSATERDADNNPKSILQQRIIFSVEGFANSAELMMKALQGLIDSGVVRQTPQQSGGMQQQPSDSQGSRPDKLAALRMKSSPNFS